MASRRIGSGPGVTGVVLGTPKPFICIEAGSVEVHRNPSRLWEAENRTILGRDGKRKWFMLEA